MLRFNRMKSEMLLSRTRSYHYTVVAVAMILSDFVRCFYICYFVTLNINLHQSSFNYLNRFLFPYLSVFTHALTPSFRKWTNQSISNCKKHQQLSHPLSVSLTISLWCSCPSYLSRGQPLNLQPFLLNLKIMVQLNTVFLSYCVQKKIKIKVGLLSKKDKTKNTFIKMKVNVSRPIKMLIQKHLWFECRSTAFLQEVLSSNQNICFSGCAGGIIYQSKKNM